MHRSLAPLLLLALTALFWTSPAAAQSAAGGATGGTGGTGGLGAAGGVRPDPDYDFRGPLAVISGVVVGAPLGLVAGWASTEAVGPDATGGFLATLRDAWAGALVGDGVGVGVMLLTAWATDKEDLGHLPFLVVPPAMAVLGGLVVPLIQGGESSRAAEGGVVLAPWTTDDGAGVTALGRF